MMIIPYGMDALALASDYVLIIASQNLFNNLRCSNWGRVDGGPLRALQHLPSPSPTPPNKHLHLGMHGKAELKLGSTDWTFRRIFPLLVDYHYVCELFLVLTTPAFRPLQEYHLQFALAYCSHRLTIKLMSNLALLQSQSDNNSLFTLQNISRVYSESDWGINPVFLQVLSCKMVKSSQKSTSSILSEQKWQS